MRLLARHMKARHRYPTVCLPSAHPCYAAAAAAAKILRGKWLAGCAGLSTGAWPQLVDILGCRMEAPGELD